jgi:2-hydroxychromene-2-carboxylate isomerase
MMKTSISRAVTTALTSRTFRNIRRGFHGLRRRLSGGRPTIHYFHQADDPYSHIAAQTLGAIAARYDVTLVPWIVSPPDDAAAPERERLREYALRDAPRLAAQYGLSFPGNAALPDEDLLRTAQSALTGARERNFTVAPTIGDALWRGDAATLKALAGDADTNAAARALAEGDALRKKLGHYLGAMFYFEGEWYWGADRLNHLEERLAGLGLDRKPGTPMIAPWREARLGPAPKCRTKPVIEYWFSFRSPYSWISFPRMRKIARHYDAELRLRFILPMVMRGLPVPPVKRLYITLDTKREAERAGIPYGTIVDPVGPGAARALAVLHHAVKLGRGEDFAELGLRAAFADGIDLASDRGLVDVARRAGLDEKTVRAALADESWRPVAEANREALFAAGLWGAPSFRVDGMPAHWGQDRFWALEEDILRAIEIRNASES